jgi:hypothetical protein
LGPIIGKAIKNIIVKAVTAPFSLLAGLVGSEDDLENIAFAPGSSELSTESREALGALAEALSQRPQLSLRVAGGSDPKADSLSLKERVLEESLIADGLAPEALQTRGDEFLAVLQKRYETLNLDNQGVTENEPVSTEALWAALLDHTALAPDALQQLATARAAAAKRELVSAGAVDAARIAIAYDQDLNSSGVKMEVGS